jgi:phosphoglycerate dehydrogenase-like enzyme
MRILFCGETFPAASEMLRQRLQAGGADEIVVSPSTAIRAALDGVEMVVPLMSRIDAALMDAGHFRLIQQWGTGLDGVDLEAARSRKIWVANVPASGGNADSVAEHTILLILASLRQIPTARANLQRGVLGAPLGIMLAGRTVTLYGLGAIAKALVRRLRGFDVRLVGITRDPAAAKVRELGLDAVYSTADRAKGLAQTDILVVCLSLSEETRGVIDGAALAALPRGAFLINPARGALVNYDALYAAVAAGRLGGVGLDVYWKEPIAPDDPLLRFPNVIATPHIAGITDRSYAEIADVVVENVERLRRGEAPLNRNV